MRKDANRKVPANPFAFACFFVLIISSPSFQPKRKKIAFISTLLNWSETTRKKMIFNLVETGLRKGLMQRLGLRDSSNILSSHFSSADFLTRKLVQTLFWLDSAGAGCEAISNFLSTQLSSGLIFVI